MSGPNGHANENTASTSFSSLAGSAVPGVPQLPAERIKELLAALEVPFHPSLIEWRVTNTTKDQQPVRGQLIPYADQRAHTDRLTPPLATAVGPSAAKNWRWCPHHRRPKPTAQSPIARLCRH